MDSSSTGTCGEKITPTGQLTNQKRRHPTTTLKMPDNRSSLCFLPFSITSTTPGFKVFLCTLLRSETCMMQPFAAYRDLQTCNSGFNTLLGCSSLSVYRFMETLLKEQAITDLKITQMMLRKRYKRKAKWIKLDEQLEEITSCYEVYNNVMD